MVASALEFRVTDNANQPIEGARVSAGGASVRTDATGRARLDGITDLKVQVEADGFEGQTRIVERKETGRIHFFTLGRPGMLHFFRGKVEVPFEPLPGTIGVLAKQTPRKDTAGSVEAAAERIGARIIRSGKNFARSGIVVLQVDAANDAVLANVLRELEKDPSIEAAGAVVRLSEDHVSFLTDLVIARFEEGIDDAAVAAIAGRHDLTSEGRFGPLGNVHRLRFAGSATYQVLEAANALAEEPGVISSEPNLAATSEEDAN
jgi:hypothetical protein